MERGERERKGDLDQYERLDGDRNQTNKSLAVKKVVLSGYSRQRDVPFINGTLFHTQISCTHCVRFGLTILKKESSKNNK